TEGLVLPQRRESGQRAFTDEDIDRLRFVLRAQRDRFWPLKVIKAALDRIDLGLDPAAPGGTTDPSRYADSSPTDAASPQLVAGGSEKKARRGAGSATDTALAAGEGGGQDEAQAQG